LLRRVLVTTPWCPVVQAAQIVVFAASACWAV